MNTPKLKVFSILFGAIYFAAFYWDLAMFRYWPEISQFSWLFKQDAGPAILWYGWIMTAAVASAVLALLTPRKLADRIPAIVVWLVPVLTTIGVLIYERRWFV